MGGAMAPAKIVQTRGGLVFFDVDVTAARLNPADVATLAPAPAPPAGRGGGPPPGGGPGGPPALTVTAEKLGDGLYRLTTGPGSYDSLLVEFKDYVMMLEAGQPEARSLAYIAETKKLYPNKPLRYVWNSHPHADHTGGLPALVAEGVTIVTHQNNKAFFENALNTPRTLLNDSLAKNPQKVKIETVGDEEGLLRRHAHGGVPSHLPEPAFERDHGGVHSQGEDPVPGRLHAAGRGPAGQRSHQGAAAGDREAGSGLRGVHAGAPRGRAADQGRPLEGGREVEEEVPRSSAAVWGPEPTARPCGTAAVTRSRSSRRKMPSHASSAVVSGTSGG